LLRELRNEALSKIERFRDIQSDLEKIRSNQSDLERFRACDKLKEGTLPIVYTIDAPKGTTPLKPLLRDDEEASPAMGLLLVENALR
jgi:hypothetical protein